METRNSGWFRLNTPSEESEEFFPTAPGGLEPAETAVLPQGGENADETPPAEPVPGPPSETASREERVAGSEIPAPPASADAKAMEASPTPLPQPEAGETPPEGPGGIGAESGEPAVRAVLPIQAPEAGAGDATGGGEPPAQSEAPASPVGPTPALAAPAVEPGPTGPPKPAPSAPSRLNELLRCGGNRVAEPHSRAAVLIVTLTPQPVRLGQVFPLNEGRNMVGRNRRCKCVLDDAAVAEYHSLITCETGEAPAFYLYPATACQLKLNGAAVEQRTQLRSGDQIGLGDSEITFFEAALREK